MQTGSTQSECMNNHGNSGIKPLLESRAIAQVSKIPGSDIRLIVFIDDACQHLKRLPVSILGAQYFFREYDSREYFYFLDLFFFVRVKGERIPILHLLHGEESSRVVGPLREIVPYKKVLMSTWRVYVSSSTCPQLMAKIGRICDKIAYGKLLYPVRGMKASIYIKRSRFGKRDSFCLYSGAAPATGTLQQQNEIQY